MSERVVVDCDRCGIQAVADPVRLQLVVGRSPDPAGGASEDDIERLDLCTKCAAWAFGKIVNSLDYNKAAHLVSTIKTHRRTGVKP